MDLEEFLTELAKRIRQNAECNNKAETLRLISVGIETLLDAHCKISTGKAPEVQDGPVA